MAEKKSVYKVALDPSKFLEALKEIKGGVDDLHKLLSKKISVQIDTQQFSKLTTTLTEGFQKLGVVLKNVADQGGQDLADGLTKGANKAIENIAGTLNKALSSETKSAAQQAITAADTELNRFEDRVKARLLANQAKYNSLSQAAQKFYDAQTRERGISNTREYLVRSDTNANGDVSEYMSAKAQTALDQVFKQAQGFGRDLNKADQILANALIDLSSELNKADEQVDRAIAQADKEVIARRERNRAAGPATPDQIANYSGTSAYAEQAEQERLLAQQRQADAATVLRLKEELAAYEAEIAREERAASEAQKQADIAAAEALKRRIADLETVRKLEDDLEKIKEKELKTSEQLRAEDARTHERATNAQATADARAQRDANAQIREANNLLNNSLGTHRSILGQLTQNVAQAAKWFAIYTAIYGTTRQIEQALSGLVSRGYDYAKAVETQQLGLRGILEENFTIRDQQGKQLTGLTAMTALQSESYRQWTQIQAASLSVVGTTEDLMTLYEGILPFAAKLGAGLDQVQTMTKNAAVAASTLGISFNDARSALIAMLQGRALTRNKLVGILGIESSDLKNLKDTPALFDLINKRLENFGLLADDAQKSLAATAETFQDITGRVGYQLIKPLTDSFASFVTMLTKSLFEMNKAGDFVPTAKFQAFLDSVTHGVTGLIAPLKQLGSELVRNASTDLPTWIEGIKNTLTPIVTLVTWLAKAAEAAITFAAQNSTFLKWAGIATIIGSVVGSLAKWMTILNQASSATSGLGVVVQAVFGQGMRTVLSTMGQAVQNGTLLTTTMNGLSASLTALAGPTVLVAATLAIGLLIQKLAAWKQVADQAKASADALQNRDSYGVIDNAGQVLRNPNASQEQKRLVAQNLESATRDIIEDLGKAGVHNTGDAESHERALQAELRKTTDAIGALTDKQGQRTEADKAALQTLLERKRAQQEEIDQFKEKIQRLADVSAQYDVVAKATEAAAKADKEAYDEERERKRTGRGVSEEDLATGNVKQYAGQSSLMQRSADLLKFAKGFAASLKDAVEQGDKLGSLIPNIDMNPPKPKFPTLMGEQETSANIDRFREAKALWLKEQEDLVAQGKKTEQELVADQAKAEDDITAYAQEQYAKRYQYLEDFIRKINAYKANKNTTEDERDNADAIVQGKIADFERDVNKLHQEQQMRVIERDIAYQKTLRSANDALTQFDDVIQQKEDEVTYSTGLSAVDRWKKEIDKLKAEVDRLNPDAATRARAGVVIRNAESLTPQIEQYTNLQTAIRSTTSALDANAQAQKIAQQSFADGTLSVQQYVQTLTTLRNEQLALLDQQKQNLQTKQSILLSSQSPDQEQLAAVSAELKQIDEQIREITSDAAKAHAIMESWVKTMDGFGAVVGFFDKADGALSKFTKNLQNSFKVFSGIRDLVKDVKELTANVELANKASGASGSSGLFGLVGNGIKSLIGAFSKNKNNFTGDDASTPTQKSNLGSKVSGALPYIGAAIAVYEGLFQQAVEEAAKDIGDGFQRLTQSLKTSNAGLNEQLRKTQAYEDLMNRVYSGSKAGREALSQMLPEIDKSIQELKDRIKQVRDSFKEQLKLDSYGSGPYGDFARMLEDLQRRAKEYLDTFEKGTKEYEQAQRDVVQMFTQALTNAKEQLQQQLLGFEGQAIQDAMKVINLMDQQIELQRSLNDLYDQRAELQDETAQIEIDAQKQAADFAKQRKDNADQISKTEKEIADTIRKAAEEEAAIRRRGVLEAQETIAQQKAREISDVRNDAKQRISDLQAQIKNLVDGEAEIVQKEKDSNKELEKRRKALAKQSEQLDYQEGKLLEQIHLNDIQLKWAMKVYEIEGAVFGLSLDRYSLTEQQGALEYQQAQTRIIQWTQVKNLIDYIISNGDGVIFNPPPGFPQIRVQIGNITIDNTDNSTYQDNSTNTTNEPGGNRRRGDKPSEGHAIPRGSNSDNADLSRQYGDPVV